jgi:hypothetical protein
MSAAVPRLQDSDLERLWGSDEPDLELVEGEIRSIVPDEPRQSRGSASSAAASTVIRALSEVPRWD